MMNNNVPSQALRTKNNEERQATRILRQNGFTWSGKPKSQVDANQAAFERRLIVQNMRGNVGEKSRR